MNGKMQLTRAEMVRLRRAKEHAKLMERAAKEAGRPAQTIARARQDVARQTRQPARKARHKFRIVLPRVPRADLRAIRIPRPRFGWRLLSFMLVAIFGASVYLAFNHPQLRVAEAKVTGNQLIGAQEINSVMNVSGQPIFLLIPSELETRLRLNFPELVSVKVEVALPNLVSVAIAERKPVIRWEQGGGYTWISEDGVAFRPHGEMPGLIPVVALSAPPTAAGDPLTPAPFISSEMVQALKGLANHVPQGTQILYDQSFGFGWNEPRGWRVYFGTSAGDVGLKMRVYEAMVNSLTQRGIRPALINVTYPTAPYYRISQ